MNYTRCGSVYVATNTLTREQYVGQTRQKLATRVYAHKISGYKPRTRFHRAVAEYGYDQFVFAEVYVAFDKRALDTAEKQVIMDLSPAYNMTKGGSGLPGPWSAERRVVMSAIARARWSDPVWRARTVAAIRATVAADRDAYSARAKAMGENYGHLRWVGHVKPPRVVKDHAEGLRRSWADPEVRARRIAGIIAANKNPEVQARRSAASTGRVMDRRSVERAAAAKHKAVRCMELDMVFSSQKEAAGHLGVRPTTISMAILRKGKVYDKYTLVRV